MSELPLSSRYSSVISRRKNQKGIHICVTIEMNLARNSSCSATLKMIVESLSKRQTKQNPTNDENDPNIKLYPIFVSYNQLNWTLISDCYWKCFVDLEFNFIIEKWSNCYAKEQYFLLTIMSFIIVKTLICLMFPLIKIFFLLHDSVLLKINKILSMK